MPSGLELHLPTKQDDILAWQIGSAQPPAVCLCCGQRFDDDKRKMMGPYLEMPYIWVCKACHDLPFLFFPDKKMKESLISVSLQTTFDMPMNSGRGRRK